MVRIKRVAIIIFCLHFILYSQVDSTSSQGQTVSARKTTTLIQYSLDTERADAPVNHYIEVDSLAYISILEANNQMLQSQNGILITFMGIMVVLFVTLLGWQWYWNFVRMQNEIELKVSDAIDSYGESKNLELDSTMQDKFVEYEEKIAKSLAEHDADLSRLLSIVADNADRFPQAIWHCASAIEKYSDLGNDYLLRAAVDFGIYILKRADNTKVIFKKGEKTIIAGSFEKIPQLLDKEKKQLLKLLTPFKEEK